MQLTNHIHAIKIPFKVNLPGGIALDRFVYVYLIYGDKVYLIDSGVKGSEKAIFDYVNATGRDPHDIDMLILTHSHPDHIGAAQAIQEQTGCMIAAHKGERDWIENIDLQFKERPIPGFYGFVGGSVEIDRILEENEILKLSGGISLKVIPTPGHSRGSIALYLEQERTLFAGDAILRSGGLPVYEDIGDTVTSLKKLKTIGNIDLLLSAWDDPRKGGEVPRVIDDALKYLERIHQTVIRIHETNPQDMMELCTQVVTELGLPQGAVNPLVARSFISHVKAGSILF
ncbi:MAG: MBL fold metallo-hydrolase [Candidatus Omnitrophica bacterium]|nr:MBL fold metallo-hydrolase [Candidatus Omnitrophota bacterium]